MPKGLPESAIAVFADTYMYSDTKQHTQDKKHILLPKTVIVSGVYSFQEVMKEASKNSIKAHKWYLIAVAGHNNMDWNFRSLSVTVSTQSKRAQLQKQKQNLIVIHHLDETVTLRQAFFLS